MVVHALTSLANSGLVTILTSLAMTYKANGFVILSTWITNWLVSWFIVFNYVYWLAPHVSRIIKERYE